MPRMAIATEEQEQIVLATWLTKKGIKFYAIPNGGKRSLSEGVKFKRCGVKSGIPDICIPLARSSYHGLYIELKRSDGGTVSDNQKFWIASLREEGYWADVANGFEEAKKIIEHYLSLG